MKKNYDHWHYVCFLYKQDLDLYYYFDRESKWTCSHRKGLPSTLNTDIVRFCKNGKYYPCYFRLPLSIRKDINSNLNHKYQTRDGCIVKAFERMQTGQNPKDFLNLFMEECNIKTEEILKNKMILGKRDMTIKVSEFITKIRISVERDNRNKNKETFDFVRVIISFISNMNNKKEYVVKNNKKLVSIALKAISNNKKYTKYEIPINCLKISSATITNDDRIEYIFELKQNV